MRRVIGNSGVEVNAIGLGCMALSTQGRPDERTGLAVIQAFVLAAVDALGGKRRR